MVPMFLHGSSFITLQQHTPSRLAMHQHNMILMH
jgi:hypothetical protein